MVSDYDFCLFDLDGTIVDVESSYQRDVCRAIGDRLGLEFSDREVEVLWYGIGAGRAALLAEMGVDPGRFWDVFHEVEDPRTRAEAAYLYDDAAVVGNLDRPTGLVTHCQSYLTEPVLDHLDVRDWFDAVVCCTDETGWKPDPGPVKLAMSELSVRGTAGLLAGDDPADVGAAWNAGLDAVHVGRVDPHERGHCVLGDHRVNALDALFGDTATAGD
jgi:phosphoglycolate phosphatase